MFEAAFAGIAQAVSERFGGPFHAGTVITHTPPVFDEGGSIVSPGEVVETDCSVQVDAATEAMRQAEGYADKDMRLLVLGVDSLNTDAALSITAGPHAGSWSLQSCERDPAAIGWVCRGRPS